MEWYEGEVRGLEAARRDRPPPAGAIAFYGSSSIRLWETLAGDFPAETVLNLGFGGSTLAACAHFFGRLVPPCRPRAVALYAGDNDLGDGHSPDQVLASFRSLADQLRSTLPGARFAFISIKPSPARWHLQPHIERTNRLIAAELAGPPSGIVDVHSPMLGPDGRPRPELYAADGLHLSPAGYRLWAGVVGRAGWLFDRTSPEFRAPDSPSGAPASEEEG